MREFIVASFNHVGIEIVFEGEGVDEVGRDKASGVVRIRVSPKVTVAHGDFVDGNTHTHTHTHQCKQYYRPAEVEFLLGNPAKAKAKLGWVPKVTFSQLVAEMVSADLELMTKNPEA